MLSYTQESYTSGPLSTTTEFKFSDGTRFVRISEEYIAADMKIRKRTRVLRSDFEGDNEHRTTRKELEAALASADTIISQIAEPPAKARTTAKFVTMLLRENADSMSDDVVSRQTTPLYESALGALVGHLTGVFGFREDAARRVANAALDRAKPFYIAATIPGWTLTVEVTA
jgi:hypothetical protein